MIYWIGQRLYRLVDPVSNVIGDDGDWHHSPEVECLWEIWIVVKLTPKGAWIWCADREQRHRWITGRTRFVSPTKAAARAQAIRGRTYELTRLQRRVRLTTKRLRALERT